MAVKSKIYKLDETQTLTSWDDVLIVQSRLSSIKKTLERKAGVFEYGDFPVVAENLSEEFFADYDDDVLYFMEVQDGPDAWDGANTVIFYGIIDSDSIQYDKPSLTTQFSCFTFDKLLEKSPNIEPRGVAKTGLLHRFHFDLLENALTSPGHPKGAYLSLPDQWKFPVPDDNNDWKGNRIDLYWSDELQNAGYGVEGVTLVMDQSYTDRRGQDLIPSSFEGSAEYRVITRAAATNLADPDGSYWIKFNDTDILEGLLIKYDVFQNEYELVDSGNRWVRLYDFKLQYKPDIFRFGRFCIWAPDGGGGYHLHAYEISDVRLFEDSGIDIKLDDDQANYPLRFFPEDLWDGSSGFKLNWGLLPFTDIDDSDISIFGPNLYGTSTPGTTDDFELVASVEALLAIVPVLKDFSPEVELSGDTSYISRLFNFSRKPDEALNEMCNVCNVFSAIEIGDRDPVTGLRPPIFHLYHRDFIQSQAAETIDIPLTWSEKITGKKPVILVRGHAPINRITDGASESYGWYYEDSNGVDQSTEYISKPPQGPSIVEVDISKALPSGPAYFDDRVKEGWFYNDPAIKALAQSYYGFYATYFRQCTLLVSDILSGKLAKIITEPYQEKSAMVISEEIDYISRDTMFTVLIGLPGPTGPSDLFYAVVNSGLYQSGINNEDPSLVVDNLNVKGAFYDETNNSIYFSEGWNLHRIRPDLTGEELLGRIDNGSQTLIISMALRPDGEAFLVWMKRSTGTGTHIDFRLYEYPIPFVDHATRTILYENSADQAGSDGGLTVDSVNQTYYMSNDRAGIANGKIYKVGWNGTGSATVLTISSSSTTISDIAYDANRDRIYFIDNWDKQIRYVNPDGTGDTLLFTVADTPLKLEFDSFNDVLYVGLSTGEIRQYTPDGVLIQSIRTADASSVIMITLFGEEAISVPGPDPLPSAPTLNSATIKTEAVLLAWSAPAIGPVTSYKVYWGTSAGVYTDSIDVGYSSSYEVPGLVNGTPYFFAVSAINDTGEGAKSNELSQTPADVTPPAIPNLVSATPGEESVNLVWDAVGDADLAGYKVQYSETSDYPPIDPGDDVDVTEIDVGNVTEFEITDLVAGTLLWFSVTAYDTVGNHTRTSNRLSATPLDKNPDAPVLDDAVAGDGNVTLEWTAPADLDIAGYILYWGANSGFYSNNLDVGLQDPTEFTINGLNNGTLYYFVMRAYDADGLQSPLSNQLSATPAIQDITPPGAPVLDTATPGDTVVDLEWTAPGDPDVDGYVVQWGTATGVYPNTSDVGNTTSHQVTGLSNNTQYFFAVYAYDAATNAGVDSNELSTTPVDETAPGAPTLDTATAEEEAVTLEWTAPAAVDVAGYKVKYGTVTGTHPTVVDVGNVVSYNITDLTADTEYFFVVSAYDEVPNEGVDSNELSATPTAPSGGPNPIIASTPAYWFEADQIALADDAQVNSWPDISGNDYDAARVEGAPLLRSTGLGGQPAVEFFASERFTSPTVVGWEDGFSLLLIVQFDDGESRDNSVIWGASTTSGFATRQAFRTEAGKLTVKYGNDSSEHESNAGDLSNATEYLIIVRKPTGSNSLEYFVNGVEVILTTVAAGPSTADGTDRPMQIGSVATNGGGSKFDGLLSAAIGWTRPLTNTEIREINNYQNAKYGSLWADIPPPALLNEVDTAALAFSLRKLDTNYAGSCIKVLRVSDSAVLDIGFDANGLVDIAAIETFLGASDGRVNTWYDQSGNARNLTSLSGNPLIATAGSVLVDANGLPYVQSDDKALAASGFTLTQPNTIICAFEDLADESDYWYDGNGTTRHALIKNIAGIHQVYAGAMLDLDAHSELFDLRTTLYNGASSQHWKNGVSVASGDAGSQSLGGFRLFSHASNGTLNPTNLRAREIVIWNRNLGTDREVAESNINSFWNIF